MSAGQSSVLEFQVYEKTHREIRELKGSLPKDIVTNLAREVLLRLGNSNRKLVEAVPLPSDMDIEALCTALISDDDAQAIQIVQDLSAKGVSVEGIYLNYLAKSAYTLGEWWNEDRVNFVEVTLGTGRMIAMMRAMRHNFPPAVSSDEKVVAFASLPGDTHTMGVHMAADLFRADGWHIELKVGMDHDTLVSELSNLPCGIIGLSVGGQHALEPLSRLVIALQFCCPQSFIFVSGHITDEMRPLIELMGVDGIAGEIHDAKEQIASLWERVST